MNNITLKQFRCKEIDCRQPILFEGSFVGVVKKICPKCKKMNVFEEKEVCNTIKRYDNSVHIKANY